MDDVTRFVTWGRLASPRRQVDNERLVSSACYIVMESHEQVVASTAAAGGQARSPQLARWRGGIGRQAAGQPDRLATGASAAERHGPQVDDRRAADRAGAGAVLHGRV